MKKTMLGLSLLALSLAACNTKTAETKEYTTTTTSTETNGLPIEASTPAIDNDPTCYMWVATKDTYSIRINHLPDAKVKGKMRFKNFEKDSSFGDFEGDLVNGIYHIWYNFQSEGMQSVREMYLKKEGDKLVTGVVDETHKGDSALVKDKLRVEYKGTVYNKVDCGKMPGF